MKNISTEKERKQGIRYAAAQYRDPVPIYKLIHCLRAMALTEAVINPLHVAAGGGLALRTSPDD